MVAITVTRFQEGHTSDGTYPVDLEVTTVGAIRQAIAARMGLSAFRLFLKLAKGERHSGEPDNEKLLADMGLAEGGVIRVAPSKSRAWVVLGLGRRGEAQRLFKGPCVPSLPAARSLCNSGGDT